MGAVISNKIIDKIDTSQHRWDTGIQKPYEFNKRLIIYELITDHLKDIELCEYTNVNLENRIGSNSENGQVFLAKCAINFALKVMPITDSSSIKENLNEIAIAKSVSYAVSKGITKYFPLVYSTASCPNIILSDQKFLNRSIFYKQIFALKERYKNRVFEDKLLGVDSDGKPRKLNLNNSIDKGVDNLIGLLNEIAENDKNKKNINKFMQKYLDGRDFSDSTLACDILCSELAETDLSTYIIELIKKSKFDYYKHIDIIQKVLLALIDFQKLNFIHNDFHLGNVLIIHNSNNTAPSLCSKDASASQSEITPLIHDFGKSGIIIYGEQPNSIKFKDIKFFMDRYKKLITKNNKQYKSYDDIIHNIDIINNKIIELSVDGMNTNLEMLLEFLYKLPVPNIPNIDSKYYNLYLKYKTKYLELKDLTD